MEPRELAAAPREDAYLQGDFVLRSGRRSRYYLDKCLVEDVVTSGGAAVEAVEALREAGLRVGTAVCVLDREEGGADALARVGVRLRPLFRASELLLREKTAAKPHG